MFILLVFYSAPLSALAEVLRSRCSASLYLPFAAMNVVNGLLWTTYGLALGDSFIYGPNMVRPKGKGGYGWSWVVMVLPFVVHRRVVSGRALHLQLTCQCAQ